jgi:excisionase family DNA binding protein
MFSGIQRRTGEMTKLAVSVLEAAEMVGIGRSSLYTLFRDGKITPRKSGKRTLILVEELRLYVESLPTGRG